MPSPFDTLSNAMSGANAPAKPATNAQVSGQGQGSGSRTSDPAFQAKVAAAQKAQAAAEAAAAIAAKKKTRNYLTSPPGS